MLSPIAPPRRSAVLAAALAAGLLLAHNERALDAQASDAQAPRRLKIADTAARAIDLGLLPQSDDSHTVRSAGDGTASNAGSFSSSSNSGDGGHAPGAYLPGRVIVKFRTTASAAARSSATQAVRANRLPRLAHTDFDLLAIDAADTDTQAPERIARELAARPDVEYAQPDYRIHPRFVPSDPLYVHQWHFRMLDMEAAWELNGGASDAIIIAVLDTGVAYADATHEYTANAFRAGRYVYPALGRVTVPFAAAPDLAAANRFVAPRDFVWQDNDPVDLHGHGTHVAGILAALTNNDAGGAGMAFNARIMPVKVLSGDWDQIFGAPGSGADSTVAQGIRYAVDNGARVLNLSLGRSGPSSPVLEEALRYAVAQGAVVTIAAGNAFEQGNPDEVPARYGATIEGVITVGAVGRDLTRAYYSAVKPYVEVVAPGGDYRARGRDGLIYHQMMDPTGGYLTPLEDNLHPSRYRAPRFDVFAFVGMQGTSMASPYVAGLAALLMQGGVTAPAAVEAAIRRLAEDRGAPGFDEEYGDGLVQPSRTLRGSIRPEGSRPGSLRNTRTRR